jgi:hypothetical protein
MQIEYFGQVPSQVFYDLFEDFVTKFPEEWKEDCIRVLDACYPQLSHSSLTPQKKSCSSLVSQTPVNESGIKRLLQEADNIIETGSEEIQTQNSINSSTPVLEEAVAILRDQGLELKDDVSYSQSTHIPSQSPKYVNIAPPLSHDLQINVNMNNMRQIQDEVQGEDIALPQAQVIKYKIHRMESMETKQSSRSSTSSLETEKKEINKEREEKSLGRGRVQVGHYRPLLTTTTSNNNNNNNNGSLLLRSHPLKQKTQIKNSNNASSSKSSDRKSKIGKKQSALTLINLNITHLNSGENKSKRAEEIYGDSESQVWEERRSPPRSRKKNKTIPRSIEKKAYEQSIQQRLPYSYEK